MTFPLERAVEHAEACYPMEACGLWIEKNGDIQFIPCEPLKAAGHFSISPLKWLEAEAAGTIKGIFHVHPDAPPLPSEGDIAAIDAWGLPWVIMSWPSGEWAQFEPKEKPQPLLGRTFKYGSNDCFGLVRDYYRRLGVQLLNPDRQPLWEQHGENLYLDNLERLGFFLVQEPKLHDLLLIQINSPVPNHGALYLGDNRILHHLEHRLSARAVYGDYYHKATTHIWRHRDLC